MFPLIGRAVKVNWLKKYNEAFLSGEEQKTMGFLLDRVEFAGTRFLNDEEKGKFILLIDEILDVPVNR